MNMTLAIILAVWAVFGWPAATAGPMPAAFQQTEQTADNKPQDESTKQGTKPQGPSNPSQNCEQSKDTCEVSPEPQQTAPATPPAAPASQPEPQAKSPEPAA